MLELVGLAGTDEGHEVEVALLVVESGLLEHCVIGGFGAGPLLRRRRGEEAFSLLAFVDGLVRSLESARSAEDIRCRCAALLLWLLLVTSSEMCPSMWCWCWPGKLRNGELRLLLLTLLT